MTFVYHQGDRPPGHPVYGEFWQFRKSAICRCYMLIYRNGSVTVTSDCDFHHDDGKTE